MAVRTNRNKIIFWTNLIFCINRMKWHFVMYMDKATTYCSIKAFKVHITN